MPCKAPPRPPPRKSPHPFGPLLGPLFLIFLHFLIKKVGSEICHIFSLILGSPWALHGMGSHAIRAHLCSRNTLFRFCIFLKSRLHMTSFWLHFGTVFCQQSQFWVKKRAPKNDSKKGDPLVSNYGLLPCQEAPGQAATIKNCSSKKQLFEHMLKQLFEFLFHNVD